jgi:Fe-S cluster assembly scaffold protein SufB
MEQLKLNETPVRTSRNFNINNIKLEDVTIPEKIENFNNVKITGIEHSNNVNACNLTYGLGNTLQEQVANEANQEIQLVIDGKKDIQVDFKFDENNLNLIDNIEIVANENAQATITIKYESEKNIQAYHNGIIKVLAKNNSKIKVVIVNLTNEISNNFLAIENILEENASVDYTIIDFGGKNSITNYFSNVIGNNSQNNINTIYLGKDSQLFDLNYIAELRGEKTNVNIEVQGALAGNSKKHFKGTIDFKKGAKKAKGNENEACTLLSDTAKSLALPMLLCSEEDVEGNHSSSAGKVGKKELFYIMSRGFTLKEAQKLIVRAKFNKILENIQSEELKEKILEEIDWRLN